MASGSAACDKVRLLTAGIVSNVGAALLVAPADVANPVSHFEMLLNQITLPPLMQQDVGTLGHICLMRAACCMCAVYMYWLSPVWQRCLTREGVFIEINGMALTHAGFSLLFALPDPHVQVMYPVKDREFPKHYVLLQDGSGSIVDDRKCVRWCIASVLRSQ